jgi:hypothetical protein
VAPNGIPRTAVYWGGIVVWVLGFAIYLYSAFVHVRPQLNAFASALCWIGFVATVIAHYRQPDPVGRTQIALPEFDVSDFGSVSSLIWFLWILGALLIVASWVRLVSNRVGWLGLCTGMVGVIASWPEQETDRLVVLIGGVAVVLMLSLVSLKRGQLRRVAADPGNYEIELVRLCDGNRRTARRLIREELKRSPGLSRAGAALAVVTRIRHERDPRPPL